MTIQIRPDGLYLTEWDDETEAETTAKVEPDRVLRCLRRGCEIQDGVTFGDIFRMVESYPTLKGFIGQYSWCDVDAFHSQAQEPMRSESDESKIEHLEVSRIVTVTRWKEKGAIATSLDNGLDLVGIGAPDEHGIVRYGVSCTPMYDLVDLPIRLKTDLAVYKSEPGAGYETLLEATTGFSLFEVLDAIYDEISFHGDPQASREFLEEMRETVEGIRSGAIETFPMDMDNLMKDLEEAD